MKLTIDQQAAAWYKEELGLKKGDSVRIYVQLGGCGSVQPGFSLGVARSTPVKPGLSQEADGILFYMEEDNLWYLEDKNLHIHYGGQDGDIHMQVLE
ncbi:HesB/YadR/YfhF family protein [Paenibacillus sp. SYP-B4298]|uniref:HesB/YadR/YfhF family protein n=1 Tax=Paenibacillus sp. SYP-B4298 TaxID=2996034 RepID=UPI0022DE4283|nr:HesB/YadR/YfhF family protein [Paenibacillus sp. SYP-B4298]